MALVAKSTTGSPIPVTRIVATDSEISVSGEDLLQWNRLADLNVSEFTTLVASGDVLLSSNGSELLPSDALRVLADGRLPPEKYVASSASLSSTTSGDEITKLSMVKTANGGTYRLWWSAEIATTLGGKMGAAVKVDGEAIPGFGVNETAGLIRIIGKPVDTTPPFRAVSGFEELALESGEHSFEIVYWRTLGTAKIRRARLELEKI